MAWCIKCLLHKHTEISGTQEKSDTVLCVYIPSPMGQKLEGFGGFLARQPSQNSKPRFRKDPASEK